MHQARPVVGERRLHGWSRPDGYVPAGAAGAVQHEGHAGRGRWCATSSEQRSTWTVWNVYAETERLLRPLPVRLRRARATQVTQSVVQLATGPETVDPDRGARADRRAADADPAPATAKRLHRPRLRPVHHQRGAPRRGPPGRRRDGNQVARTWTASSWKPLWPCTRSAPRFPSTPANGRSSKLSRTSPARIVVGIGPAGAGKTTAMRAFAHVWQTNGGRVVPLATSSHAAQVLGTELGERAENLHKFLHEKQANVSDDPGSAPRR